MRSYWASSVCYARIRKMYDTADNIDTSWTFRLITSNNQQMLIQVKSKLKEISKDFFLYQWDTYRNIQSKWKNELIQQKIEHYQYVRAPLHIYAHLEIFIKTKYRLEKSVYNVSMLSSIKVVVGVRQINKESMMMQFLSSCGYKLDSYILSIS